MSEPWASSYLGDWVELSNFDVNGRGERHIRPMAEKSSVERGGFLGKSQNSVKTTARSADVRRPLF
jgi:hypothetical protein